MNICVVGTGYVGLVAGACFAEMGNDVICVDNNLEKIASLHKGIVPIYEPRLEELININVAEKRLSFTDNLKPAIEVSELCFIAVGTPQDEDGSADLKYVFQVAEDIGKYMNGYKIIVDKSTVPVGTAAKVREIISKNTTYDFDIVSNPEFLKQGAAVKDFLNPDRIIIGADSQRAAEVMQDLYAPFKRTGSPILTMDVKSAEMTKYAANSFLAVKISYINEIANICEKVGADIEQVRAGITLDKRIGSHFLYAGLGYGGSCFPKDVKALIKTAKDNDYNCEMLSSADNINKRQRLLFFDKIVKKFGQDLSEKTFALWGLAFKPNTNDIREAPAITIIEKLLKHGAKIQAYDPKAESLVRNKFKDSITYCDNSYEALKGADALVLVTEWNEFKHPDFDKIKSLLKSPIIFDGRNQYTALNLKQKGFDYYQIGKV